MFTPFEHQLWLCQLKRAAGLLGMLAEECKDEATRLAIEDTATAVRLATKELEGKKPSIKTAVFLFDSLALISTAVGLSFVCVAELRNAALPLGFVFGWFLEDWRAKYGSAAKYSISFRGKENKGFTA